ncbi:9be3cf93-d619-4e15-846d-1c92b2d4b88e [Thermothielavioides terrestris]|uniref:9be3cf93-d619-4e15-846d-1c92b2d4b88e n=1 Tax=Thermothielavioides terrestris TaxID=2587410 RepID=A0A3S4AQ72_9PEZI|nr:9be3cf93-d619-4e15-846d-1c92b2d4b88e [Thermothielavioides terrestris]
MAVPPEPPPKELPPRSPPSQLDFPISVNSPSQAPVRPPPPRPAARPQATPTGPPPARPLQYLPQAPLAMNPPTRPGTAASQTPRTVPPYGQGKYGRVELVPQPSDDPDDPLSYNVSYTAVAALTGVPLMLSALAGFICLIASRVCGKRPLYLVSLLLVFIGTVWNTNVPTSFNQCMAARVFQGLGWGAFDTLVLGSIQDTYFEHERGVRVAIYSIVAVTTTWGPPLIGGVVSQHQAGASLQFTILSAFFVVAVPAMALGAPETAYDRAFAIAPTPSTAASQFKTFIPPSPRRLFTLESLTDYIVKLKPYAYRGPAHLRVLLQAPRASITPTTGLLVIVSFLPYSSLWGIASSLSLFFDPLPFVLSPGTIGALMVSPFLLGTAAVAITAFLPRWQPTKFTPKIHMLALATGSVLRHDAPATGTANDNNNNDNNISVFALQYLAPRVNLPAISFLLGLLAAGSALLGATAAPLIAASAAFTGSSLAVSTRSTADMSAAVACWRALLAGVFVVAVPNAVWWWDGLRRFCVGVGTAQMLVAVAVGAAWWVCGEAVRRWDGRVMGLVDLEGLKGTGSFFELD